MPTEDESLRPFTIRLSTSELAELESLRQRLQERASAGDRITQRRAFLAALERLKAHLDKLDRDRGRER